MTDASYPALVAVLLGVGIGVILFVPFVAIQYRREGKLTLRQVVLWSGFLLYGLALWTYTLLPLPSADDLRCSAAQLVPFTFVHDAMKYPLGSVGEIIRNPAVMQVALNVLLFVPLGVFLRLIWRRGVVVSALAGFAISLAIETTQITGVWGIYPCAYRLFDVDDLIANTSGAILGGLLSLVLVPWLERRAVEAEPVGPRRITVWRRLLGMLCDALSVVLLAGLVGVSVNAWQLYIQGIPSASLDTVLTERVATIVPLAVFGIIVLVTGRTVGDAAVLLRWERGPLPAPIARTLRYLAGIGGWQVLAGWLSGADALFAVASIIAVIATAGRGGLPGLLSGMRIADARMPAVLAAPAGARESAQGGTPSPLE